MKHLVMIYCHDRLLGALPDGEFDSRLRGCLVNADTLCAQGQLLDSQQLEAPVNARPVRVRGGRAGVVDGPFAETKEYLGGFNRIEATDMDEAVLIVSSLPWAHTSAIEIRPVRDVELVRRRIGA